MAEILVASFQDNIHRASGVLDELRVLDEEWILELADSVAVHRDIDGSVAMDQSYQPTGRRAAEWGATLGLIIGASLSIPLLLGASPVVAGGAVMAADLARREITGVRPSYWRDLLEIPAEFFERASQLVKPGNSAIFAILEGSDATLAASRFQRYGGTILDLTLTSQQHANIKRLLKNAAGPH
jgi:uncharacterized membrane protein